MPTCRNCGADHDVVDLVRHERDGTVVVHCPDCSFPMGRWDSRAAGR
ncbi:MAG: hypothetical protein V5A37_04055 [Halobacteriales archaeon]